MHHVRRARFRFSLALLVLCVATSPLAAPSSAEARIYRWVDADGRVHYSDILEQVPEAQRPGRSSTERRPAPVEVAVVLPSAEPPAERAVSAVAAPEVAVAEAPGPRAHLELLGPLAPVVGRISPGSLLFLALLVSPPLAVAGLAIGRLARLQLSPSKRSKSA